MSHPSAGRSSSPVPATPSHGAATAAPRTAEAVERFPTLVLVPGMWHGAWAWQPLEAELTRRGLHVVSLTFPGKDRLAGDDTFAGHCRYLQEALQAVDGPAVVVSHSYGGAVVSEAGDARNTVGYVFVAAFCFEPGESVAEVVDAQKEAANTGDTMADTGGYLTVDPAGIVHAFYHDCPPELAQAAVAALTPERAETRTTRVTRAAWRSAPSHYVVCTEDRAVTPQLQRRLAARLSNSSDIPTSHSPMLSRPAELADLLEDAVRGIISGPHAAAVGSIEAMAPVAPAITGG